MNNTAVTHQEKIAVLHSPRLIDDPMPDGVIIDVESSVGVERLLSFYGDRVRQVHFKGDPNSTGEIPVVPPRNSLDSGKSESKRLKRVLKYFAFEKEDIIKHSRELKKGGWLVCPEFPLEKPEDITFITSMGIAVDLLYCIDALDETLLMKLAEFYLHYPQLAVPVEPFHSILLAKMKRNPLLLWHLHLRFPGLFYHVKGNEEPVVEVQLTRYLQAIPDKFPGCMSCSHLNICFAWAKFEKDSCQKWRRLLNMLQWNVRQLEQNRNKTYSV